MIVLVFIKLEFLIKKSIEHFKNRFMQYKVVHNYSEKVHKVKESLLFKFNVFK